MSRSRVRALLWAAFVLLGAFLADDYGLSTDEPIQAAYGRTTLWYYLGLSQDNFGPANLPYYGPFFSALVEAVGASLDILMPSWTMIEARHFLYFLAFLLGVWALYDLGRRVVQPMYAAAAAALFASQPVLFGHAFINPKDIPFMGFFLATVAVGLRGVDRLSERSAANRGQSGSGNGMLWHSVIESARESWQSASGRKKALLLGSIGLLILGVIELYAAKVLLGLGLRLIGDAYNGQAPLMLENLFARLAPQSATIPLDAYLSKARQLYGIPRRLTLVFLVAQFVVVSSATLGSRELRRALSPWAPILVAGVFLGLTTSIRVAGPFAGVLVSAYCLQRGKAKLGSCLVLWGTAGLVTFATWPALWSGPVEHILQSLKVMSDFSHGSLELYMGSLVPAEGVPWHFAPVLIASQLTLPALLLAAVGVALQIRSWGMKSAERRRIMLLALAWLLVPLIAQLLSGSAIYGNMRVLLFALPPLFLFAAVGLEALLSTIPGEGPKTVLVLALLIPGVVSIVRLHPYEYIYYNMLAGGTRNASERYETDYWCTSLREATEHVNLVAPPGVRVGVHRVSELSRPFARQDLQVYAVFDEAEVRADPPEYLLVCPRSDFATRFMADAPVIWQVERAGAELTAVKVPDSR